MKAYVKGRKKEYEVMKILRGKGDIVFRTAGSRSSIDLIDFSQKGLNLIQVKSREPTPQEIEQLKEFDRKLKRILAFGMANLHHIEVWWRENYEYEYHKMEIIS